MPRPRPTNPRVRSPQLAIVHEDEDLLIVNKPAGLLTSTTPSERRATLLADVEHYLASTDRRARCGLIHRLDRDASGLLVFSKNNPTYHALKTQFFHHTVTREYLAVVDGKPKKPVGEIQSRLIERADGTVYSTRERGKGQAAATNYEVVKTGKTRSLLRIKLHTGRKHQIRVHTSEHGWPIVGDRVYGKIRDKKQAQSQLLLCAVTLGFEHPRNQKPMLFTLAVPKNFEVD